MESKAGFLSWLNLSVGILSLNNPRIQFFPKTDGPIRWLLDQKRVFREFEIYFEKVFVGGFFVSSFFLMFQICMQSFPKKS